MHAPRVNYGKCNYWQCSAISTITCCLFSCLVETTPPGSVNIFGIPKTRNSLTITFLPPGNTIDSLLTDTSVFYRSSRYTNYADASLKSNLVVDSSATGRYEYTLSGLSAGTRYWVAARATNMMGQVGDEAPFLTVLDTFGNR